VVRGDLKRRKASGGPRINAPEVPQVNSDDLPPVFGMDQMRSPYTVKECHAAGKSKELLEALWRRSKSSWRELTFGDHTKTGFEPIFQSEVPGSRVVGMTPDQKLLVLRFAGGACRIVGYRQERIYHIVWVDTKLDLYDH
jgi:hypothetical protein